MGMNLWLIPQISEHCPKKIPERLQEKQKLLIRPGMASILIPKEGIVQEWITSAEDKTQRTGREKGTITELSTSNKKTLEESPWIIKES